MKVTFAVKHTLREVNITYHKIIMQCHGRRTSSSEVTDDTKILEARIVKTEISVLMLDISKSERKHV